ncbi:hypothetical protein GGI21_001178 [Coemansia aciculifera]|nr:hypothetical protein GGI21_001178 [Coemansia aciculifera]
MDEDSANGSSRCSTSAIISPSNKFTLRVRQTNGTIIEHPVPDRSLSIAQLKLALSERTEIPVERMRLMLESKILADDESLESYGKYQFFSMSWGSSSDGDTGSFLMCEIGDGSLLRLVQLAGNHIPKHPRNVNGISRTAEPTPPSSAMAMTNQARQRSRSTSRPQPFSFQQHRGQQQHYQQQQQQQQQQLPAQMSAMSMSSADSGLSISAAPPPPSLGNLSGVELSLHQERYRSELSQLEEMGFTDKDKNLRALIVTDGDLSLALNIIADCDDD